MIRLRCVFLCCIGWLVMTAPLRALEWHQTERSVTPEPGAEIVRARFTFKNASSAAVHILGIDTECGCTEATPSASTIAPGESGTIDVLFTIGARTGLQERAITVRTDDAAQPMELTLIVVLPEVRPAEAGVERP